MYFYGRRRRETPTTPYSYVMLVILILSIIFTAFFLIFMNATSNNKAKQIKEQRESIEIQVEGGKTVLDDALLRSDYEVWYRSKEKANTKMRVLLAVVSVMILSTVVCSVGSAMYLEKRGNSGGLDKSRVFSLAMMVVLLVFIDIVAIKFLQVDETKPEEAVLVTREYQITSKDSVKRGKSARKYYLYTKEGGELVVDKADYDLVKESETYYFGMQDNKVFNIYPKDEYCQKGS